VLLEQRGVERHGASHGLPRLDALQLAVALSLQRAGAVESLVAAEKSGPLDVVGLNGAGRQYEDLLGHTVEMCAGKGLRTRVLDLETVIQVKQEAAVRVRPSRRRCSCRKSSGSGFLSPSGGHPPVRNRPGKRGQPMERDRMGLRDQEPEMRNRGTAGGGDQNGVAAPHRAVRQGGARNSPP